MNCPPGVDRSPNNAFAVIAALAAAPLALVAVSLAMAAPAFAPPGTPDFRAVVDAIAPAARAAGLKAEVVNFDDHVVLTNDSGSDILILGYDGEPYARMSADGRVEVNLNSPTYYLNEDRFANVALPERADKKAKPAWEEVESTGRFEWHDHRSHYMSEGTPPQVKDESQRTKVFDYRIPIEVDGKSAAINGTLFWHGKETGTPLLPFIVLAVAVLGAGGFLLVRRRNGRDEETVENKEREVW